MNEFLRQWNVAIQMVERLRVAWNTEHVSNGFTDSEQALWDEYGRWCTIVDTFCETVDI